MRQWPMPLTKTPRTTAQTAKAAVATLAVLAVTKATLAVTAVAAMPPKHRAAAAVRCKRQKFPAWSF